MNDPNAAYFGSPDQQAVQRRAEDLWALLHDNPAYSSHGRAVGLADFAPDRLADHVALARLQGAAPLDAIPEDQLTAWSQGLENAGLVTDCYRRWEGQSGCFEAAKRLCDRRPLPGDLALRRLSPETPPSDFAALAAFSQSCEVLLPMASFFTRPRRPALCLYAQEAGGRIVGAAAALGHFHPDHPDGKVMWWGMLSTAPDRRGEGIALRLGAQVLGEMQERFGFEGCFTGVRDGNAPSEAVCSALGVQPTDQMVLVAMDPQAFADGRLTK